jgi:hypothetical protein
VAAPPSNVNRFEFPCMFFLNADFIAAAPGGTVFFGFFDYNAASLVKRESCLRAKCA